MQLRLGTSLLRKSPSSTQVHSSNIVFTFIEIQSSIQVAEEQGRGAQPAASKVVDVAPDVQQQEESSLGSFDQQKQESPLLSESGEQQH